MAAGAMSVLVATQLDWLEYQGYVLRGYGGSSYAESGAYAYSLWRFACVSDVLFTAAAAVVVVLALIRLGGRGRHGSAAGLMGAAGATLALLVSYYSPSETLIAGDHLPPGKVVALAGSTGIMLALLLQLRGAPRSVGWPLPGRAFLALAAAAAPIVNLVDVAGDSSVWESQRAGDIAVLVACATLLPMTILPAAPRLPWVAITLGGFLSAAALANGLEPIAIEYGGGDLHIDGLGAGAWLQACLVAPLALTGTMLSTLTLRRD